VDIGRIAEEAVVKNLRDQRWTRIIFNKYEFGTNIQANNPGGALQLFQVKTAVAPDVPAGLSEVEKAALITRAKRIGAVPYEVKVQLNKKFVATSIRYSHL
jgi:hypothetical protein